MNATCPNCRREVEIVVASDGAGDHASNWYACGSCGAQADGRTTMTERCINLTAHEVRGILDGSITQLRRVVKGATPIASSQIWSLWWSDKIEAQVKGDWYAKLHGPFGEPGDLLIGRETWQKRLPSGTILYRADGVHWSEDRFWKSPATMPKSFSRIARRVKTVRVQQLGDAWAADAIREGIRPTATQFSLDCDTPDPRKFWRERWNANAKPGDEWDPALWTFVAEIERGKGEGGAR